MSAAQTIRWPLVPVRGPTVTSTTPHIQVPSPYGTDVSTFTINDEGVADLDPLGRTQTSAAVVLSQACARRLSTPPGGLMWDRSPDAQPVIIGDVPFDDPNYGFWLPGYVNSAQSNQSLGNLANSISAECVKDERILSVAVSIGLVGSVNGNLTMPVSLRITPQDPIVKPFTLVLNVTQFAVAISNIGTGA